MRKIKASTFSLEEEMLETSENTSAKRVGRRIRKIRMARKLSQAELGAMVGLTADRIQKYENGVRKPKTELLKSIAKALDVNPLALVEPTTSSYLNVMFAFFELEEGFDARVMKSDTGFNLSVGQNSSLYSYMKAWYEKYSRLQTELNAASSQEERELLLKEYQDWKWTFPQEIEELQEAYDKLND